MNSTSGLFRLNINDFIKGIATAFFSGFTTVVLAMAGTGVGLFSLNLKQILLAAIGVGIVSALGYLQKNFLTADDKHETMAGIIPTK